MYIYIYICLTFFENRRRQNASPLVTQDPRRAKSPCEATNALSMCEFAPAQSMLKGAHRVPGQQRITIINSNNSYYINSNNSYSINSNNG